eukprot:3864880-Amphidinium_carterae.1
MEAWLFYFHQYNLLYKNETVFHTDNLRTKDIKQEQITTNNPETLSVVQRGGQTKATRSWGR